MVARTRPSAAWWRVAIARSLASTCCVLLASCGGDVGGPGPAEGEAWTVEGPTLRIGSLDDSASAFQTVQALAMSPTGVLHSLHFSEAWIRRWDADGQPAGMIGGEGEGPGEFTTPGSLGFFGDSLWVMDRRAYRVSFFDLSGDFLGSVTPRVDMSPDPENPHASAPRPSRPLRDGSFYGVAPAWSDAIARGNLSEAKHVHMNAQGDVLATVWVQPYRPKDVLALLRDNGGTFGRQPFGDQPLVAVTPQDELVVLSRRAYEGHGRPTARMSWIAMTGDTLHSKDLEYIPEPLPEETVDSAAHAQAQEMLGFVQRMDPGLSAAGLEADLREAMYAPEHKPAFRGMVVAQDGSPWLQEFETAPDGARWRVLGRDGVPRAVVSTPEGLRVLLVTDDAVWGVETDEFDVNYIVRYEIVRG